jgi:predicted nucleic acid-binding protein
MTVVTDTSPLNYLVLIGESEVLPALYGRVLVPQMVIDELKGAGAPGAVQSWIIHPPAWLEIRPDPLPNPTLALLDPGEHAAILLALFVQADRLLMDDWDGRAEAERRHLVVSGTLGVLARAHQLHLIDFEVALARLSKTNFYLSKQLVDVVRHRLAVGGAQP